MQPPLHSGKQQWPQHLGSLPPLWSAVRILHSASVQHHPPGKRIPDFPSELNQPPAWPLAALLLARYNKSRVWRLATQVLRQEVRQQALERAAILTHGFLPTLAIIQSQSRQCTSVPLQSSKISHKRSFGSLTICLASAQVYLTLLRRASQCQHLGLPREVF